MMPLIDARGRPLPPTEVVCPGCRRPCPPGDDRARVTSAGFGAPHDCCRRCGYDFDAHTIRDEVTDGR